MKDIFIGVYSKSDIIARPWAEAGYECHLFDLSEGKTSYSNIIFHSGDIRTKIKDVGRLMRNNNVAFVAAFPPCTDMATCGAKHMDSKAKRDAFFWAKAMELVYLARDIGEISEAPYFIENPRSMIASLWRKKDHSFDPCDFGGYLSGDHRNTLFPEYYPPQDAYNKDTWLWTGGDFVMPDLIRVEPVSKEYPGFRLLGGKSERTKEIRSVTPEGFARAVFAANCPKQAFKVA